jgi:ABC-type molybdate transport system substrate-binding protein
MRLATSICATALIPLMVAQNAAAPPARAQDSAPPEVMVYAVASLPDVLRYLAPRCEERLGIHLVFNFGASNDLA